MSRRDTRTSRKVEGGSKPKEKGIEEILMEENRNGKNKSERKTGQKIIDNNEQERKTPHDRTN